MVRRKVKLMMKANKEQLQAISSKLDRILCLVAAGVEERECR